MELSVQDFYSDAQHTGRGIIIAMLLSTQPHKTLLSLNITIIQRWSILGFYSLKIPAHEFVVGKIQKIYSYRNNE